MFINKAVYMRSITGGPGNKHSLTPGTNDLLTARELAKIAQRDPNSGLPTISTISNSELDDLAQKHGVNSIGYGYLGLLEYNPAEVLEDSPLTLPSPLSASHTSHSSSSNATSSEQNDPALRGARSALKEPAEPAAETISAPDNNRTNPPISTCSCYQIFTAVSIARLTGLRPYLKSQCNGEDDAIQFFADNTRAIHVAVNNSMQMCPKHIKQLAASVNMQINISRQRLMISFARVSLNAQNREKWSRENVKSASCAHYFKHGPDSLRLKLENGLCPLRYSVPEHDFDPQLDKSTIPFVLTDILKRVSNSQRHNQPIDILAAFDWWFDGSMGTPLIELARLEIDMYNHHLSSKSFYNERAFMPYFGYGLFQQLFESDPVVYIIQQRLRNLDWSDVDSIDLKLLALPQPILFAQGAFRTGYRLTEPSCESGSIFCAYLPLSSETPDVCAHYITGVGSKDAHAELVRQYQSVLPEDHRHWRQSSAKTFMTLEQPHIGEVIEDGHLHTEKAAPCEDGALRLWRSDILVAIHVSSDSKAVRKGLQSILVSANDDTGCTFDSLRDHRRKLTPLDIVDGDVTFVHHHARPPFVQHLNVPTALSQAILGQESWGSFALREAALLLGTDHKSAWNYIQGWRQMADCLIRNQFENMKATERKLYKEKSFYEKDKYGVADSETELVEGLDLESHELSPFVLSDDIEEPDDGSREIDVKMEEGNDSWSDKSNTDDNSDVKMEGNGDGSEVSMGDAIKEEPSVDEYVYESHTGD